MAEDAEMQRICRENHNASIPLLKLPTEIINQVIEEAIEPDISVEVHTALFWGKNRTPRNRQQAILQVCRKLRNHALPIFRSRVAFVSYLTGKGNTKLAQQWLRTVPDWVSFRRARLVGWVEVGSKHRFMDVTLNQVGRDQVVSHSPVLGGGYEGVMRSVAVESETSAAVIGRMNALKNPGSALSKGEVQMLIDIGFTDG